MPPGWKVKPPKDDKEYFERMTRTLFTAGLNWNVIEKKWPTFRKAFSSFDLKDVARFPESRVKELMKDQGIVRNERKIRATIYNAGRFLHLEERFGSFRKYLDSFGKDEARMQEELSKEFHHLGPSTTRMFLWSAGYPLTPNSEEKKWMATRAG